MSTKTIIMVPLYQASLGIVNKKDVFINRGKVRETSLQNAFRETIQSGGRHVRFTRVINYASNNKDFSLKRDVANVAFGKKLSIAEALSKVSDERLQNWLITQDIVIYNPRLNDFIPWNGQLVIPEPKIFLPDLPHITPEGDPVLEDVFVTLLDKNGEELPYRLGPRTVEDAVRTLYSNNSFEGFTVSPLYYYANGAITVGNNKHIVCKDGFKMGLELSNTIEINNSQLKKWCQRLTL